MPSTKPLTASRLANLGANVISQAFDRYRAEFKAITLRAKDTFAHCDWHQARSDAVERLDLYKKITNEGIQEIRWLLDTRIHDKLVWASIKAVYSGLIDERDDWELAETFFNSITRRSFATVGLDPQIEFVDTDFETPPTQPRHPVYHTYAPGDYGASLSALIETVLGDYQFEAPYADRSRDAGAAATYIQEYLSDQGIARPIDRIELVKPVFYRSKGAYLVGRICSGEEIIPLALALLNTAQGVTLDAVMLSQDEVSILFSFTHSYFHVAIERPYDLVRFLTTILPQKRIAELYISLGYNKHGKTELYRELLYCLATTDDQFEIARGERGMVMTVFNLPPFDMVFKVIKDQFDFPKSTTRHEVMAKYHMVFQHDRAGRLVDAQEFEHLKFERSRFSVDLLEELLAVASQMVVVKGDYVIIRHCYVERRLVPLNLYLQETDTAAAVSVITDYGEAIKDLAATNIFTGDMLLKNFGVTRFGRVVCYDYDELCLLTACNFREMPHSDNYDDEMSAEPWYSVGEHDVFPEEFIHFLVPRGPLRETFLKYHGDLFHVEFWWNLQSRLKAGEVIDIFPYHQHHRMAGLLSDTPSNGTQPEHAYAEYASI